MTTSSRASGMRPLINGRGTYRIISGSRSLPQVKQTMFEASHYFVELDEMMDGIGAYLGQTYQSGGALRRLGVRPPSASPRLLVSRARTSSVARRFLISKAVIWNLGEQ